MTDPRLKAALDAHDEYVSACPINNPKQRRAYAPHDKCERCGARADQNCGLAATAGWHLLKAVREIVNA